ncbi:MAG: hypothetical protein LKJ69_03265 [Lactobacillus sp.]|jgi:hypothetical protein|nr:hypothetical protein [Lactobacillus sp.]MCI2032400.1 hypothetical protein [Lactobacillus sp.]
MTNATPANASHGWFAFFGLIQSVLLILFAAALGLTLTIGTPAQVTTQLTQGASLQQLTAALNAQTVAAAKTSGLVLATKPAVVTPAMTRPLIRQGVTASADFHKTIHLEALEKAVQKRLRLLATQQRRHLTNAQWQALDQHLQQTYQRRINGELMQSGWGAAYGMLVLVLQTITIVTALLGGLVLILMRVASHSWQRWLRGVGRLTYIIGFLGGIGAIIIGSGDWVARLGIGGVPVAVVAQLVTAFAPMWQRVAGLVVVCGLVMAAAAYLWQWPKHKD